MSNPIRFAVVGTGWRSEFMVRMAKAAPDRLEAVAVLARSDAAAEKISRRWGVPVVRSLDELLARGPEFVVAAVSWPSMPGVVTDLVERGAFVLAETPPAPTADGLRALWAAVGTSGRVQVAEQYHADAPARGAEERSALPVRLVPRHLWRLPRRTCTTRHRSSGPTSASAWRRPRSQRATFCRPAGRSSHVQRMAAGREAHSAHDPQSA